MSYVCYKLKAIIRQHILYRVFTKGVDHRWGVETSWHIRIMYDLQFCIVFMSRCIMIIFVLKFLPMTKRVHVESCFYDNLFDKLGYT